MFKRGAEIMGWARMSPRYLPFADAATKDLPLSRLLRMSLFQITVGMAVVLLTGTLNRVMIVELGISTWLVALMVSVPLVFAPFRALIGHRSDTHKSFLGWRRVPFIWVGTLLQFGGLSIMPFALIILSGDTAFDLPAIYGQLAAGLAFLLTGAGLHTVQTAGLALATDMATEKTRPRVVALMYVMLLVGMAGSALCFGAILENFDKILMIKVIQGAAVITLVLNVVALWKQEARNPKLTAHDIVRPTFSEAWADLMAGGQAGRLLFAIAVGTAAFSMQDILLEPYGGEILNLNLGQTTTLTALLAGGSLLGFVLSARLLGRGGDPNRLAAFGALIGVVAFSLVIFSGALNSPLLFRCGTTMIGLGAGLFAVGTLTASMALARDMQSGLALGAWGAVQATAAGGAIMLGGALRDIIGELAVSGALGTALQKPITGYMAVYHLEILLLFVTLAAIGPLVRYRIRGVDGADSKFGLAELPG